MESWPRMSDSVAPFSAGGSHFECASDGSHHIENHGRGTAELRLRKAHFAASSQTESRKGTGAHLVCLYDHPWMDQLAFFRHVG